MRCGPRKTQDGDTLVCVRNVAHLGPCITADDVHFYPALAGAPFPVVAMGTILYAWETRQPLPAAVSELPDGWQRCVRAIDAEMSRLRQLEADTAPACPTCMGGQNPEIPFVGDTWRCPECGTQYIEGDES